MSSRNCASGARHGVRRKSRPAPAGPPPAAYAVPVELNMATSGGSPTVIADPDSVNPRRNLRRETRLRLVITCDMRTPFLTRKLPGADQRQNQRLKIIIRSLEILEDAVQRGSVRRRFHAARGIAEILFHHALLALRRPRQNRPQFPRRGE